MEFPADENGDVLRRMHASGVDMEIEHDIDFWHRFENRNEAEAMCERVRGLGHSVQLWDDEDDDGFDVQCVVRMVPAHADITARETEFGRIAELCGGHADGWGMMQE